ncbi:DNA polymerase III subunit gamma/tau [Candidatus Xenohaliotis californiensis]|uniref:DNA polymerase III subunit gamma/tau n=1 Tax=Candidatus Xenohaliotis californiensis TaxID=84677 RepID=A0ABM9N916_9RICK|nr:DNA polymerase III subunit gamma/tau [Candidatus Xenohaliotis californiensis]
MTNVALAIKYRPKNFHDLIDQNVLVQTITNSIKLKKLAKAFLLTGTRGVGKTTTARIIAKCINCSNNNEISISPCNICNSCRLITNSNHPDVIEMDAASNTGVDDIRLIKEMAAYSPSITRAKVYIIDEVHMLSNNAFNALLKIIEEPPVHVYWILATTEMQKIPVTIVSRCQNFTLNRIAHGKIIEKLSGIAEKEGYTIDRDALSVIASGADGSMRDGISLLEMALLYVEGLHISAQDVRTMLNMPNRDDIIELFSLIVDADVKQVLKKFHDTIKNCPDHSVFLVELLKAINQAIHICVLGKDAIQANSKLNEKNTQNMLVIAQKLSLPQLDRMWQILFKGMKDLELQQNQHMLTEILIIRLTYINKISIPLFEDTENTVEVINNEQKNHQLTPETLINMLKYHNETDLFNTFMKHALIEIIGNEIIIRWQIKNTSSIVNQLKIFLQKMNLDYSVKEISEKIKASKEESILLEFRENFLINNEKQIKTSEII